MSALSRVSAARGFEGAHPVPDEARYLVIDIVRGLALLGVFLVNIREHLGPPTSAVDGVALSVVHTLFEHKSYSLFALMFGIGLALQLDRWKEHEDNGVSQAWRRLMGLYAFGIVLYVFLDANPILLSYAVAGVPMVLLRNAKVKWLALAAALVLTASVLYPLAHAALWQPKVAGVRTGAATEAVASRREAWSQANRERTYSEWVGLRARIYWTQVTTTSPERLLHILSLGLIGMLVKRRLLAKAKLLCRRGLGVPLVLLALATFFALLNAGVTLLERRSDSILIAQAYVGLDILTSTGQAMTYMCLVAAFFPSEMRNSVSRHLAAAGQMTLTHFFGQSLFMALVFHSYGFGRDGLQGPLWGALVASAVWLGQVISSRLWLDRFTMGPLEMTSRLLTYGSVSPRRAGLTGEAAFRRTCGEPSS